MNSGSTDTGIRIEHDPAQIESVQDFGGSQPSKNLSVIVLTRNRPRALLACLQGLRDQTAADFDVIVVDNGSDAVPDLSPFRLRLVRLRSNTGAGAGRNYGFLHSAAAAVVFVDDDAVPDSRLVESYLRLIEDPTVYAARGRVLPLQSNLYSLLSFPFDLGDARMTERVSIEGNMMVRSQNFREVGGWRANLFPCEGLELSFRLANRFGREGMIYTPDAVIRHPVPSSFRDYLSRLLRTVNARRALLAGNPALGAYAASYPKQGACLRVPRNPLTRVRLEMVLAAGRLVTGPPCLARTALLRFLRVAGA